MIFSANNRFLRVLYQLSMASMSFISETALQDHLKISYKDIHELASFWERKGCVVSMTQRGGITHYQLTDLGSLEIEHLQLKRRFIFKSIFGGVGVLILCIIIFTLL